MQNWESYSEKTNLFFLVFFMRTIMCLLSMTYAFVVGHSQLTLSRDFISICILMSYILKISVFSHLCTFVREYYFGL
ncbi:hypothetical protein DXA46_09325 [Bacteroides sp. OF02-3LB]|nr:hypothetical protein DWY71_04605 [Bacteroides sp. AF26-7BH]RGY33992.1 hypothetical protein DXA46_09325 [Bacteroides sp. OF02-3LB]